MESHSLSQPKVDDLERQLLNRLGQIEDLAMVASVLTSIKELQSVLTVVMDLALRLVDGEVGLIFLEEKGDFHSKISWGVDERFIRTLQYKDGLDLTTYCFQHRESAVLNDLTIRGDGNLSVNSLICVPIKTASACFGVIVIVNKGQGGGFSDEDQQILEILTNFVAVGIDNYNLMQEQLRQQKVQQEMHIARQIQETILPQNLRSLSGVDFGVSYFPAGEVGGDFYDVLPVTSDKFVVVIGDVSNKGVPAALIMSAAAGILKSTLRANPSIPANGLVATLNDILVSEIIRDREMFVTLFLARFDMSARTLSCCNAGHLPGLLWTGKDKRVEELTVGGPIVGQFAGLPFEQEIKHVESGDRLFLFTDGLTEAMDADRALFGRERVVQVFSTEIALEPQEFCQTVKHWVDRFIDKAPAEWQDDFTTMQIRVN